MKLNVVTNYQYGYRYTIELRVGGRDGPCIPLASSLKKGYAKRSAKQKLRRILRDMEAGKF